MQCPSCRRDVPTRLGYVASSSSPGGQPTKTAIVDWTGNRAEANSAGEILTTHRVVDFDALECRRRQVRAHAQTRISWRVMILCFAFRRVPIVQRPRTWPFQGQNTGSNPVGDVPTPSLTLGR